jgi:hypothetical protein
MGFAKIQVMVANSTHVYLILVSLVFFSCTRNNNFRDLPKIEIDQNLVYGCQDIDAENFDSEADSNEFTCTFRGCLDPSYAEFDNDFLSKVERYELAAKSNGQDWKREKNVRSTCSSLIGCTLSMADNFNPDANSSSSCSVSVCMEQGHPEYVGDDTKQLIESYINEHGGSINSSCEAIRGCMLDIADNYNSSAVLPDPADPCSVTLCDDPNFKEFDQAKYDKAISYKTSFPSTVLNTAGQCQVLKVEYLSYDIDISQGADQFLEKKINFSIFVDNSLSMAENIDKVKTALESMAVNFVGKTADIFIYRYSQLSKKTKISESVVDGKTIKKFRTTLPDPFQAFSIDKNMDESEIKSKFSNAMGLVTLSSTLNNEKFLCTLNRYLHYHVKENETNAFLTISDEDDAESAGGALSSNCELESESTYEVETTTSDSFLTINHKVFYQTIQYLDGQGEPHLRSLRKELDSDDPVYNANNYDFIEAQGGEIECSEDLKLEFKNSSSNVDQITSCKIRSSLWVDSVRHYAFSDFFDTLDQVHAQGGDACGVRNFTIDGIQYNDVKAYIIARLSKYTEDNYLSCNYIAGSTTTGEKLVSTKKTTVRDLTGQTRLLNALPMMLEKVGENTLDFLTSLFIYFDPMYAATCSAEELQTIRPGVGYGKIIDKMEELNDHTYFGNVCENNYNEIVKNSIGRLIEGDFVVKYKINNWNPDYEEDSLVVKLIKENGDAYTLDDDLFTIELDSSDNHYYIHLNDEAKGLLEQDYKKLRIDIQIEN